MLKKIRDFFTKKLYIFEIEQSRQKFRVSIKARSEFKAWKIAESCFEDYDQISLKDVKEISD